MWGFCASLNIMAHLMAHSKWNLLVYYNPTECSARKEFEYEVELFNDTWSHWGYSVSYMTILFPMLANHQIRLQTTQRLKWSANLVNEDCHLIFLRGYIVWVNIFTLSPSRVSQGRTWIDKFPRLLFYLILTTVFQKDFSSITMRCKYNEKCDIKTCASLSTIWWQVTDLQHMDGCKLHQSSTYEDNLCNYALKAIFTDMLKNVAKGNGRLGNLNVT